MTSSAQPIDPDTPELLICALDDAHIPTTRYRGLLTPEERQRIDALKRPDARHRSLVARALLRLELAERLDCQPHTIRFAFGPEGKPDLAAGGGWHFNLSHSGDRVVLALARNAPVGVDIESHRRRSRIEALAQHYYGLDEQAELAQLDQNARRAHFFRLWTIKEAVTKALGRNLWTTLSGIHLTDVETTTPRLRLEGRAHCEAPLDWWHWYPDSGYSMALVQLDHGSTKPMLFRTVPGEWRKPWPLEPDLAGMRVNERETDPTRPRV